MYTRILNTWSHFRSSFWFIPTTLMLLSVLAAMLLIRFDATYGQQIVESYPLFEMSPPAARSILSSIVGAMVSTTGVVFSITIVALSLASSQFGSRLIRTYRNRRTTHLTLGIFVSTSLFCILVLASIREINDFSFVPTASVAVGILLASICLLTLVYYIHDMSRAIQAPNVIHSSAADLDDSIRRSFPADMGDSANKRGEVVVDLTALRTKVEELADCDFQVKGAMTGYLQAIENETLMDLANKHDLVIRIHVRPGDFLHPASFLGEVWVGADCESDSDESFKRTIRKAIFGSMIVGAERTHMQDVRFAFAELVEIAVRALSPGINDPYTAVNCVDRIFAALITMKNRKTPSPYRLGDNGELRVIAQPVSLDECVDESLLVIANYAEGSPMVEQRIKQATVKLESEETCLP